MINVGANKGYNVAEFVQRFHAQGSGPSSNAVWHAALLKDSRRVRYGCGMCNACRNARGPRVRHHEAIDVHAIEMVVLNAKALQRLFAEFHVPGTVHHLALSNYSGIATYGSATAVGLEHFELDKGTNNRVRVQTLDRFVEGRDQCHQ
eukprot:CAMPEP_0181226338 /NCGR_PEP_ID=MMETSP1096-20121128/32203_1 /TAXON_ID=156174 ORGANISM="Chrysochromulina ericina, Strain CCMP281" /NCGR_SAMPLE_ID=MMETSP1096 /ASSEMBLY_ACC=CAM_ASM_000453 /LENGTH=147 /DNA_ID=CAMNT_0023319673 /DNA_START=113 /DNA_END=556 /DNA_ORIENTATION=-